MCVYIQTHAYLQVTFLCGLPFQSFNSAFEKLNFLILIKSSLLLFSGFLVMLQSADCLCVVVPLFSIFFIEQFLQMLVVTVYSHWNLTEVGIWRR